MLERRNFLIPDATFVIEMVAFVVVLVVMTRYVVPHIRERMHERQRRIDEALAGVRDADRRRHEAESAAAAVRADARREAGRILAAARSMRDDLVAEGRRTGLEEYRWLAGRADRDLQRRTALAREQLTRHARTAAIVATRNYVGPDADADRISGLVDEHLEALVPGQAPAAERGHVAS